MRASLYDAIQAERAKYPEGSRSAVLPALRLAQEEHGWLSPDVMREVASSASIATFYDQFNTEPVGEHLVEVCTNVSCALYGAQQVLESFEADLDCHAGETSADGKVTLRTIECLGGCGWGTIVAVDHRYHLHVRPEDTAAIVEELRGG